MTSYTKSLSKMLILFKHMDILVIINQLIKFFIIMGVGYFLYKKGMMDAGFNKKLTNIIIRVTMPCLMVSSVFNAGSDRDYKKVLFVFLVAIIMYASFILLGMLIAKLMGFKKNEKGLYVFMTIFGNTGFLGFPLVEAVLGTEAIFYTSIFNMIFNLCIFTIGIKAIDYPNEEKGDPKESIKKVITHPGIIGALLSIIIYFANITFPSIVASTITTIGGVTSPVAMLLMGASLAKIPVSRVFNDVKIYIFTLIKMIVIPAIAAFIIHLFISDELIAYVTLIMIAVPVANNSVMFAIEYNKDEETAAKNVFISTMFSIVSIPVVMYIFSVL